MKPFLSVLVFAFVLGGQVTAEPDAPKLSDLNILRLQNALLQRDLAQARLDLVVRELTIPGYELMGSGDYVKKPDTPKAAP